MKKYKVRMWSNVKDCQLIEGKKNKIKPQNVYLTFFDRFEQIVDKTVDKGNRYFQISSRLNYSALLSLFSTLAYNCNLKKICFMKSPDKINWICFRLFKFCDVMKVGSLNCLSPSSFLKTFLKDTCLSSIPVCRITLKNNLFQIHRQWLTGTVNGVDYHIIFVNMQVHKQYIQFQCSHIRLRQFLMKLHVL